MLCTSCGRANDATARFCSACGARLDATPADATRKIVTVVFTDVAGSTALGERLDPESLRQVMGRYFETVRAALERHGGTVEKFIGDAVMAVFGVPAIHEDDALRAVRAVFELGDTLERLNGELERDHGVRIATRTGVNTGEVIVGGDGSAADQRLATGDAVNVAARLEQSARPGEVLLGTQTYDAVHDAVVAELVGPMDVKGKSERLTAWRLVSVRPDVPAFSRPISTRFVGRRSELGELGRAFHTAARERVCTLSTVVGPPGIGKSRLARELIASVETDARVVIGRCVAYGRGITYLPLAEIVHEVAGDDSPARVEELLAEVERGAVAARLIAGAVGTTGEAGSPEETAWAFRRLFETLAQRRPLLIIVDDIHWAEPTMLDLLEYVAGFSSGAPIALLCLARPELFDARPTWATPRQRATVLALEPLASTDAERLVDAVGDGELPLPLRRRILDAAEGNPLFVEQMLAMVANDPAAADREMPATIQAVLAARIDALETEERSVLQRAAVEGRHFHRGAVAELLRPNGNAGLGAILLALARKELVRPDRASYAGDDAFRFNHVLIRDVAYASMPKQLRADLHVRLAGWLESRTGEMAGRDEIAGYHLEQAYGYRIELGRADDETRALAARAGALLAAAGSRALDRWESGAAASLLDRACRLLDAEDPARARLLVELGRALGDNGALDEAEQTLAQALDEARTAGDEPAELRAEMDRARIAAMRTQPDPEWLRATARRAISIFEQTQSDADLADAWQLMGVAELMAGDRGAQLQALLRGRDHAVASGDTRRQIDAWNEVGGSMLFGRTPIEDMLVFMDEELAWGRERGLGAIEADALLGGAYLHARLGHFDEARALLERSKELARDLGIQYGLAEAYAAGAQMEMLDGDAAAAERELRTAITIALEMGASRYVALYRVRIAHVLISQDRDEEALSELEQARDLYGGGASWLAARARVLARRGAIEEAVALARKAAALLAGSDDITTHAETLTNLAEVLRAAGDLAGAAEALSEATDLHDEKGNVLPAQACREMLATIATPTR